MTNRTKYYEDEKCEGRVGIIISESYLTEAKEAEGEAKSLPGLSHTSSYVRQDLLCESLSICLKTQNSKQTMP